MIVEDKQEVIIALEDMSGRLSRANGSKIIDQHWEDVVNDGTEQDK